MSHDHKSKSDDSQGANNPQNNITNYLHFELLYFDRFILFIIHTFRRYFDFSFLNIGIEDNQEN